MSDDERGPGLVRAFVLTLLVSCLVFVILIIVDSFRAIT